jgi:hypothetical protein
MHVKRTAAGVATTLAGTLVALSLSLAALVLSLVALALGCNEPSSAGPTRASSASPTSLSPSGPSYRPDRPKEWEDSSTPAPGLPTHPVASSLPPQESPW